MSISGAVAELDKELASLNKEIARITQIRESLVQEAAKSGTRGGATLAPAAPAKKAVARKKPGPKPGSKKSAPAKKSASAKAVTPPAKRVISAATRKKMSDAAKARAAAKASEAK
jgi:hypothetical protein